MVPLILGNPHLGPMHYAEAFMFGSSYVDHGVADVGTRSVLGIWVARYDAHQR